jgi:hypothetical protein
MDRGTSGQQRYATAANHTRRYIFGLESFWSVETQFW